MTNDTQERSDSFNKIYVCRCKAHITAPQSCVRNNHNGNHGNHELIELPWNEHTGSQL